MARPRIYDDRVTRSVRLPIALNEKLNDRAESIGCSANLLVELFVTLGLERLPLDIHTDRD